MEVSGLVSNWPLEEKERLSSFKAKGASWGFFENAHDFSQNQY